MFSKLRDLKFAAPLAFGAALWSAAASAQGAGGLLQKIQEMEARIVILNHQMAEKEARLTALSRQMAEKEARLQQTTQSVNQLRAAPSARRHTDYSQSRGGGANAIVMGASCQPGEVVVGVELVVGGTCRNYCDADGGALHKFRLICGPRVQ